MIDGINCRVHGRSFHNIMHCGKLQFKEYPNRREAKYKGLILTIYTEPLQCCLRGSIHKFKNEGVHNADPFTYQDFVQALNKLEIELKIYSSDLYLVRFEIGVNVSLPVSEKQYLNTMALINNKVPTKTSNCLLVPYQQYQIKIYSKSKQYSQFKNKHTLRLELAYLRKVKLTKDLGRITTIDELLNQELWTKMADVLNNLVSQIVFFDYSEIKPKELTDKECLLFYQWSNPLRLSQETDKSKKSRLKKQAIDIYQKYSKNRKANELKESVNKQLQMMLDYEYTFATN